MKYYLILLVSLLKSEIKFLFVLFNQIKDIDTDINGYLKLLEGNGILNFNNNIDIFIDLLNNEFNKFKMNVKYSYSKDIISLKFTVSK
ncbi:hypothetical protein [Paraclostridium sordellii]|uniref:hypothetical protein n=1 Tax=Paraclostridium sordellii TaxID=1505 RepID=UPI0007108D7C|nr:hypothetical protein [Paeniclostridium sordellii]